MKVLGKSLLAVGMTLGFGASIASAQTPVKFGLGGGVTIPSGSTSNGLKTGWHGMGLIQFKPATSPVGFQVDGAYQQLKFDGGGGKDQIIDGTAMRIPWNHWIHQPQKGERWQVNLFRCVGKDPNRGYLAWQPTKTPEPGFHVPQVFGWLVFG